MKIRKVNTSSSDRLSAEIFFDAVDQYWNIEDSEVLDMFARNGQLTVSNYVEYVGPKIDLWELSADHKRALQKFSPREIKIGCSYRSMLECSHEYDFVVIDTPQGVHTDWQGTPRYEHFTVIEHLRKLLKPTALLVLYVNMRPYDRKVVGNFGYDDYSEYDFEKWMNARIGFYECINPERLTMGEALDGYRKQLGRSNIKVGQIMTIPCYSDVPEREPYAFRVCMELFKQPYDSLTPVAHHPV